MKVAIIQEGFVTVGGSDKVTEALFDIFPDADIYTLVAYRGICEEQEIPCEKVYRKN